MTRHILCALLLCPPAAAAIASSGRHSVNVSMRDGSPARCDDLEVTIDGRSAVRDERTMAVAPPAGAALRIRAARNSGIRVEASDRRDVLVLACKAASSREELDQIRVSFENGLLTAVGPAEESWSAYLIIEAPRAAALELEATNGPISIEGLTGRVTVRSQNGPISVKECSGTIDANAQNGPISVAGSGGDVRVRTENGPISVRLSGQAWDGPGLDARAVNGPISLKIPDGYRSGAVVESAGRSPFRCKASACDRANRSWDDDGRRVELGGGALAVRLSTVNGPVTVSPSSDPDED
jgi:DUF4097 and DUF4098 domain-containing protein YvlB